MKAVHNARTSQRLDYESGTRNKYAKRFSTTANVVTLNSKTAKIFGEEWLAAASARKFTKL